MARKKLSKSKVSKELMKKFKVAIIPDGKMMVDYSPVQSVEIYCTACTKRFILRKKDDKGILVRQQVCPHTILEIVNL